MKTSGYVTSRWDSFSAKHPLTRSERATIRQLNRTFRRCHAKVTRLPARLIRVNGQVVRLVKEGRA